MAKFKRGKLIEYDSSSKNSITNEVVFQFNPETLTRTIQLPTRSVGSKSREVQHTGDVPYEDISLTIQFSAADQLNVADVHAQEHGVAYRLAALERMVRPIGTESTDPKESVDKTADAVSKNKKSGPATKPTPRYIYPDVLFTWGEKKMLPVVIHAMTITEKQYDANLNPVEAEVTLGLYIMTINPFVENSVARGAVEYSDRAKKEQEAANMVKAKTKDSGSSQQQLDIVLV